MALHSGSCPFEVVADTPQRTYGEIATRQTPRGGAIRFFSRWTIRKRAREHCGAGSTAARSDLVDKVFGRLLGILDCKLDRVIECRDHICTYRGMPRRTSGRSGAVLALFVRGVVAVLSVHLPSEAEQ